MTLQTIWKHFKTFYRKELYDLCLNISHDNKKKKFDRIRQWLNNNKDDDNRLKAAITYQGNLNLTSRNLTPLHLILYILYSIKPPLDIIQTIIKYAPEVLKMKTTFGYLPIHYAVRGAVIAASHNFDGLPLRPVRHKYASLDVLNLLIESYPEGMDLKDKNRDTPLDILKKTKYAEKKDHNGMLLLHHACNNEYSLHLIHFIFQAYPESTIVQDNDGNTPLKYLTKAASHVDERGMLLLHREAAHFKGLNVEILPILFHANPEAIRLQDKLGLLPIHHASLNEASSLDALMLLIKLYPEGIVV